MPIDHSLLRTREQKQAEADQRAWSALRAERDRLLAVSDFTQVNDWPGDAAPWREYRKALRDLPETVMNPAQVEWPQPPG